MNRKAVALFSGGLDSTCAIRVIQQQGIDVVPLHVRTPFDDTKIDFAAAEKLFGVPVRVIPAGDAFFELIKRPRYVYGKGANPCTDCKIYFVRLARDLMEEVGASFVITGEVIGQRPNSQMRMWLRAIEARSGLRGYLLRPLSAKRLPPTVPETEGIVDRERLYGLTGRSRKGVLAIAESLGIARIPVRSIGCALCRPEFGQKVFDLIRHDPEAGRWDFLLLRIGRHMRLNERTRVVMGKNERENDQLAREFAGTPRPDVVHLIPHDFNGPHALVIGDPAMDTLRQAAAMVAGYARQFEPGRRFRGDLADGTSILLGGFDAVAPAEFRDRLLGVLAEPGVR